ncbi:MAG: FAD-binding protein [Rhodothermales bacterium]|nr:FAD-binding protein [Rhodothermales bacterium]MBO6779384.1 FAD-binding protein [Rhodothermales bacterium]
MGLSRERILELGNLLRGRLEGELRLDALTRALYATDASMYEVVPVGALIPRSIDDVEAAVKTASDLGIPILPRGGGSSLAGQTVNDALVIDFSPYLHRLVEFDEEAGRVTVEPGVTLAVLNLFLAGQGWMVGPDPASASRATIGGMVGNNSTGTHSILYGNMIRHVHGARVVLADGSVTQLDPDWWSSSTSAGLEGEIRSRLAEMAGTHEKAIRADLPPHWRRCNGYRLEELLESRPNPARLLCGSEGTLATLTEVTIDLVRKPAQTAVGAVHFDTRREALQATTAILETRPSAVELLDGAAIRRCQSLPEFAQRMTFVEGTPGAVLMTEYFGDSGAEVADGLDRLEKRLPGIRVVRLEDPRRIAAAWSVRKEALGLIMGVKGDHKPVAFIEDAAVPVEHLADYIEELEGLLKASDTPAVMYAHASGGCLHVRPFINTKDAAEVQKMRDLAAGSAELVTNYGGWVSSEHGDGLARSWLNPGVLGPELYDVCREVKRAFDPEGIMNPRRVVDAPAMTENLRLGPDYDPLPVVSIMPFAEDGGFVSAVEQCNGNGACRKLGEGTMCPSFMATRQEIDSTRGRANVLRMALNGRVEGLGDAHIYDALELCLQCKACKRECPSAVDMARMKTEWLEGYWRRNGTPLKARAFAELPTLARMASGPMSGVVNRLARAPIGELAQKALNIDQDRPLPTFARHPFARRGGSVGEISDPAETVALFVDTFSNFQHPEVPQAATQVLEAAGFTVIPVGDVCCGRTLLSKGFVTKAQRRALRVVERLFPFVQRGVPVVGLEPSCILTLNDEYRELLAGDPRTDAVGKAALEFEQFLLVHQERFRKLSWKSAPDVLVHGHCHQKALGTFPDAASCYNVCGTEARVIDAGCCGMAGSFGYEFGEVSRAIAEDRLMPAVRAAPEETVVAAAGTSCRAQIADLTGRRALHPAQVLAQQLSR